MTRYIPPLSEACVYKSFNTIGCEHWAHAGNSPLAPGPHRGRLSMLLAGAPERCEEARVLVSHAGFDPKYVGPIR